MGFGFQKAAAKVAPKNTANNSGGSAPKAQTSGTTTPKGFIKTGAQASQLAAHEEQQREIRKSMAGKTFRFRMKDGEEKRITFLDGDIGEDGMLTANAFYEHAIQQGNTWTNICCVADAETGEECPICKQGTFQSYFAAAFTVIDHSEYTIEKGPNAGKTIANTRRLFVCKHDTYKQLTKLAAKRGGLAGCTFDVSRSGAKSPAVGNVFDFHEKIEDGEELMEKYGLKEEELMPLEYEKELTYLTADEMIQAGFGVPVDGHGHTTLGKEKAVSEKSYQNEL